MNTMWKRGIALFVLMCVLPMAGLAESVGTDPFGGDTIRPVALGLPLGMNMQRAMLMEEAAGRSYTLKGGETPADLDEYAYVDYLTEGIEVFGEEAKVVLRFTYNALSGVSCSIRFTDGQKAEECYEKLRASMEEHYAPLKDAMPRVGAPGTTITDEKDGHVLTQAEVDARNAVLREESGLLRSEKYPGTLSCGKEEHLDFSMGLDLTAPDEDGVQVVEFFLDQRYHFLYAQSEYKYLDGRYYPGYDVHPFDRFE